IETSDLSGLPPPSPTKLEKVRSWIAKNSGGPNLSAISASSGAKNVISTIEKKAPTNDDVNAAVSAWPPRPCRASGYPSKVVATDHGSPGMLNSTEVIAPPNSAPQYNDVRRMIAEVGGIVNVSGSRIATPLAPPRPGSTPMLVPRVMPTTATNRLYGVIATWKPRRRFSIPIAYWPSHASSGPLGIGTRNHFSKMKNVASGNRIARASTASHEWRPIQRM